MKKVPYKLAKKALDNAFSFYIRRRDSKRFDGICPLCQRRPIEVAFHFLSRNNLPARWDEENAIGSCKACNFQEHMQRGRISSDDKWKRLHIKYFGQKSRDRIEAAIREKVGKKVKFSVEELKEKTRYFLRKTEDS